jgi:sugar lactone lactonase YvrE
MKRLSFYAGIAALAGVAYGCSAGQSTPTVLPSHFVYVSDFAVATGHIAAFGLPVTAGEQPIIVAPTGLSAVVALAFDSSGNLWAVNDFTTVAITGYHLPIANGSTPFATINIPGSKNPIAITFDGAGNLWFADGGTNNVFEFTPPFSGNITPAPTVTITSVVGPGGLAFDSTNHLYVSSSTTVEIFNCPCSNGQLPTGSPLTGANSPVGLAFDAAGNLYAENTNGDIDRWNAPTAGGKAVSTILSGTNTLITNAGTLAFDSAGNLYSTNIQSAQLYDFANAASTFSGNMPVPLLLMITSFGTNGTGGVAVH